MAKIKYGKKDLISEQDLDPEKVKERISIWVPEEIINAFKERAKDEDSKYQTLMNEALKEYLKKRPLAERVKRIEEKLGLAS
jgi:predicted DNA binding CopG/RHH family protein